MGKISGIINDYFSFNRKEQRGIFVLISILAVLITADIFISEVLPQKPVDFTGFEKEITEFEKEMNLHDSLEKLEKQKKYHLKNSAYAGGLTDSFSSYHSSGKENFIIELNSADTFELQRLRGIGPSFAKRIVRYRERLGGYIEKSQLLEIFGMDQAKYDMIKDHLMLNPDSVRRIDLNAVTFKELLSHPYFPFELTKNIMIYRKEHRKFKDKSELLLIKAINDSVYGKITPYIKIN